MIFGNLQNISEYTFLEEQIQKCFRYVKENDMKLAELISNAFNNDCTVLADNDIAIGGLKAQNADGTLIADDTLDTRLSQQYEWFLSSCNLSIELQ